MTIPIVDHYVSYILEHTSQEHKDQMLYKYMVSEHDGLTEEEFIEKIKTYIGA